jgi:opacity protein-like surface antigen
MKIRSLLILGITLLLGSVAVAQDDHKIEVTGDYSYFRLNPGLPSVWNSQNLNGGGAQGAFYFKSWLALAADFQGYGSFTQCPKSSSEFVGCASGNLFTYTFGPQVKYRAGKFEPFAEVLLGGAHSNFYANACNKDTGICGSRSPSNNAFALAIGGGVDIAVSEHIAIRLVDADYELTRFGNNFTGGNNSQSNFRFQTGVQFRF